MSIVQAAIPCLSMTAEDHRRVGSTPPQELVDNPNQRFHESMNEGQLGHFMQKQITAIEFLYREALSGDDRALRFFKRSLESLSLNISYLRDINRLPESLINFDLSTSFVLPSPKSQ